MELPKYPQASRLIRGVPSQNKNAVPRFGNVHVHLYCDDRHLID